LQVSEQSLTEIFSSYLKREGLGALRSIRLLRPSPRDRAEKIQLVWGSGEVATLAANDFRSVVGFEKLRSTFFEVQKRDEDFSFRGRGFGHGVGLCQWGARSLGQQGRTYQEILSHYYPQARIQSLQARTERELETQTGLLR
jgi:stage II sporulation protein D